jgi:aspartate/methionine/tyrosine aminotransferase
MLLKEVASKWSSLFNREIIPTKNLFISNGASAVIGAVLMSLVRDGDFVHTFEPFFSLYIHQVEMAGARLHTSPMFLDDQGQW